MKKLTIALALLYPLFCGAQTGIINTIAGMAGAGGYNGDAIAATGAKLNQPEGVAVDATGNVYIADQVNNRIRKVATTGIISTIAGTGVAGYSGDGGQATSAKINNPNGVRVSTAGIVYFSDGYNAVIREVLTTGVIHTIAGNNSFGNGYSGDGGNATSAELDFPVGLGLDNNNNLYIADQDNNVIRKVALGTGIITTVAGNHALGAGFSGNGGPATSARLNTPTGVAADNSGNIYIADYMNNEIRVVTGGNINAFAGTGVAGYNVSSGPANTTQIYNPAGVSTDAAGNVYLTDPGDGYIREVIKSSGNMFVIAGNAYGGFSGDGGAAVNAELNGQFDVVTDASNNVYIADLNNNRIRKITAGCAGDSVSTAAYNYPECHGNDDGIAIAFPSSPFTPYTYSWSPTGLTTQQISSLAAGVYTVYVSDGLGCSATGTIDITQPAVVTAHATILDNVTCNGAFTGAVSVGPGGGTSPYAYSWTPYGGTAAIASGLSAGTFTITVTDFNGCTGTSSITITQPTVIIATATVVSNINCRGESDGSASVSVSGGTSPYTYSWAPTAGTTTSISGLSAGSYTIYVTDNKGCLMTSGVTITQPATGMTISIAGQTNVACLGGTGSATANVPVGGTSPYNYVWTPSGGTNLAATNLSAGTYTITATDAHGCTASVAATITQPATLPTITIASQTNINCQGGTGSATANAATGGTSPYNYNWTPSGGTNLAASNLSAGSYTITATDNHGCTATASVSITQPANALSVTIASEVNIKCSGGTGSAIANVATGGTSPYNYNWTPSGGTNLTASNLSAGTYTITSTDNHGCTASATVSITQPASPLSITIAGAQNINCFGGFGTAIANSANGGTSPYNYNWTPSGGTNLVASNLSAGTYTINVTDNNGCLTSATATITQPASALTVTGDSVNETSGCNGAASVTASGGTSPYTYSWTTGGQTTDTINGQCAGTYCCNITDYNGCTQTICVTINFTTGTNEVIANSDELRVYPDPNNGNFTIDGLQRGQIIEMYNYTGQKINSVIATDVTLQVNIGDKANGVYLIRILSKDGSVVAQRKIAKTL